MTKVKSKVVRLCDCWENRGIGFKLQYIATLFRISFYWSLCQVNGSKYVKDKNATLQSPNVAYFTQRIGNDSRQWLCGVLLLLKAGKEFRCISFLSLLLLYWKGKTRLTLSAFLWVFWGLLGCISNSFSALQSGQEYQRGNRKKVKKDYSSWKT